MSELFANALNVVDGQNVPVCPICQENADIAADNDIVQNKEGKLVILHKICREFAIVLLS